MSDFDSIVARYARVFPQEEDSLKSLRAFLLHHKDPGERVERSNFQGHVTVSTLFVDAVRQRILLFLHPAYQLILQPGGHFISPNESPLDVATRKLFEETPYTKDKARYMPCDYDSLVPFDIDSHHIPHNEQIGERAHAHHDFRYVFLSTSSEIADHEVRARKQGLGLSYSYTWYDLAELNRWTTFSRVYSKLRQFLSRDSARRRFYMGLVTSFPLAEKVNTVIVTHVLPDAFDFLDALSNYTNLIGVIPKPKSIHEPTRERLIAGGIPVLALDRQDVVRRLPSLLEGQLSQKTVLLDIGGWFAPVVDLSLGTTKGNILGIIEDTRNGQDKYEALAKSREFPFPVVSVAESALKANEDFLVGQSIVFSADAILRELGLIIEYLQCGVVGYGKIGRSIAYHLHQRGVKPYVVERVPLRLLEAFRERCEIRHRDWVSRNADVIFCATGSRATDIIDFRSLKPGAFLFSVTSSDDEFDLNLLPGEYRETQVSKSVSRYDGSHNHFYLVNGGNAVNFLHRAVLWEFIQLVKGGIFVALRNLVEGRSMDRVFKRGDKGPGFDSLLELSGADQEAVAKLWLETVLLGVRFET
jgi:hypothetical protein